MNTRPLLFEVAHNISFQVTPTEQAVRRSPPIQRLGPMWVEYKYKYNYKKQKQKQNLRLHSTWDGCGLNSEHSWWDVTWDALSWLVDNSSSVNCDVIWFTMLVDLLQSWVVWRGAEQKDKNRIFSSSEHRRATCHRSSTTNRTKVRAGKRIER